MRPIDIPRYRDVIDHYVGLFVKQDVEVTKWQSYFKDRAHQTTDDYVGFCKVYEANYQDGDSSLHDIDIHIDNELFQAKNPLDNIQLPLAALVVLSDGTTRICINARTYELGKNELTVDIAIGVIAHEVGHILAGHPQQEQKSDTPPIDAFDLRDAVVQRLEGKQCGSEKEFEADLYAIGLVGFGPILAYLTMQAAFSYCVGVKMEFANRIQRFLNHFLDADDTVFETTNRELQVVFFEDDEISTDPNDTGDESVL